MEELLLFDQVVEVPSDLFRCMVLVLYLFKQGRNISLAEQRWKFRKEKGLRKKVSRKNIEDQEIKQISRKCKFNKKTRKTSPRFLLSFEKKRNENTLSKWF